MSETRLERGRAAHAVPLRVPRRRPACLARRAGASRIARPGPALREGEPATCFFVLLWGTVSLSRRVHGDDVELVRTSQRGVYGGATQAYLGDRVPQIYPNSLRAVTDVSCSCCRRRLRAG